MNGKSIRKRLMKHRSRSIWGARAYITLKVPVSAFPEPPPPFNSSSLGDDTGLEGHWERDEDGKQVRVRISRVSSGTHPDALEQDAKPYLITQREGGSFQWWEGVEETFADNESFEVLTRRDLPEEVVQAYISQSEWIETHLCSEGTTQLARDLGHAHCYASALNGFLSEDLKYAYFAFSVKWFYPNRKRAFCAAVSRAIKRAKGAGVEVRVLR